LIGGSIGLAIRQRGLAGRVIGIGRSPQALETAVSCGAIDQGTTDPVQAVRDAQLIVIATPVDRIVLHATQVLSACGSDAIVTDAGSTKQAIVQALDPVDGSELRFVGSHPLAGSEKTGAEHATAELFVGRTVVVTPTERTRDADITRLESFWTALGARVCRMSPEQHDRAVAATSHAPHLIAAALALATDKEHMPLVASGWLDTTRIAAADAALWEPIFAANREHVLKALASFETTLLSLRRAIEAGDGNELTKLLAQAGNVRKAAEEIRNGNALGS
jgi:prephenate dehydrogenase